MRIGFACKLLLMEDISISQLSSKCGFETVSHFNKTFKKNTGYVPSQYRKMMLSSHYFNKLQTQLKKKTLKN